MEKNSDISKSNGSLSENAKTELTGKLVTDYGLLRRLNTLNDIALQIENAQTREEILVVMRNEIKWLINYNVCFIGLLNKSQTHYMVLSLSSIADATELDHKHFSIDEGMLGWVIQNRSPILEDIESGPAYSEMLEGKMREFGIKSLLIVPLFAGNDIIGSLTFGSTKVGIYTDDDSGVAQLLGIIVASALKNTSMFEDARKRLTQIELINEVSSVINSTLKLDELLKVAAQTIQRNFNYFDVTIFIKSSADDELILEAHSGSFVDFLPNGYRQKIGDGIVGWVAARGEKVLSNDVSFDPRYKVYTYHSTRSELALPIKIDNVVVGVLNIEDTKLHAFDETDSVVLETLCDQLGSAIKNASFYDEVCRANISLTELDKMKTEFLGIVSHDFRSPLSSIILAGKSLLKNETVKANQRIQEYLQLIVDQANRLNQLAEDTLSITKIESGQLNFYFKIVNVARLIQDAIAMVRFSTRHRVEYHVEPNVAFIKGDQAKLRQVIQNLVGNAVKYSPRGGKVAITAAEYSPEEVLISVSDEGIGIPPQQIDKLFKKFSRVNDTDTSEIKGTGLGLWICNEIVKAHGGKIWVKSEVGKGSTFKLTLKKSSKIGND